ncbi:hypothetical protein F8154_14640 [Alkaliphilus pronyensis]|uniref:Recombinase family protein n=1 Tax=Alkaliphilus pronyensis TaxID=1482732 RepID=A0A6I0F489_9FIRM|nr:recombinase family protein [Alkaliphilus pronyensis]KAB3529601.1 hypothetical protein F8154_14640 [Alkaliphilus pronyensis]
MYGIDNYQITNIKFSAAIYCRLSREDEGSIQSESIKNQKEFLVKYVSEQGWQLHDIYVDDGYTGTNFERPDFQRLLKDIEKGSINLVITKDLSRLGRDYITTGYYLEKYFPEKRVRYIAVNDGIDTFINSAGNDISPFRSVINDLYARDISVKVRSSMESKQRAGKFIGAFAPYGYKKDPQDKNKLIIDEETAPTVRRIFQMYLEGYGFSKIAHKLNNEGIITPTELKAKTSNYKGTSNSSLWSHSTIKCIITNPTYIGDLAQKKRQRVNYKSEKLRTLPQNQWIVVEDTHEAIIDKRTFEDATKMLNRKSNETYSLKRSTRLFSGFIFCGDCGSCMTYTKARAKDYIICSTYKRFTSKYCTRHSFLEDKLKDIIIEDIKEFALGLDKNKLLSSVNKRSQNTAEVYLTQEIRKIQARLNEITKVIKALYTDKVKGILEEKEFMELNNDFKKEKETLSIRLEELQKKLSDLDSVKEEGKHMGEIIDKVLSAQSLDRYSLEKLVKRIEIFEDNRVKIYYRFKNPAG